MSMNKNDEAKDKQLDELMELHERITELQKLEIERERTEDNLRKIDEKIHKLFHKAKEVITIIQDRQVKYVNPQVTELIGYTPDEVIGIMHKDGSEVSIEIKASVVQYQGRLADFAIVRKVDEPDETS